MGTAGYLVQALAHALPVWCLPSVVAIMGAVVSFATGSAFGTMGVMFPLTLPLGMHLHPRGLCHPQPSCVHFIVPGRQAFAVWACKLR
jgi:hypothetical protein